MHDVDLNAVYGCIHRSLELFDRTYTSVAPGSSGWYHRLEASTPGPSATAVALHSYLLIDRSPARQSEALAFLRLRQVSSPDTLLAGGWAVNTSGGHPVLEATSLVVRLLGFAHLRIRGEGPDLAKGHDWIVANQNPDGGWGSFRGQPSRVWLTAMAVRALVEINLGSASVTSGVEWLLRARDPDSAAWGERPQGPATVTHTAFVLTTLVDSQTGEQRAHVGTALRNGYEWLQSHVDTTSLYDDAARTESYNVTYSEGGKTITWQNAVWHPGLPYALAAMVRHPEGGDPALMCSALGSIVTAQSADGRWPNADSAAGVSVWSVWPFVEALSDFARKPMLRQSDRITWLSPNAILIRRGPDRSEPWIRLAWRASARAAKGWLRRHWAVVLLAATVAVGAVLALRGILELKEFLLALVLPVLLLVVQEFSGRRPSS